MLLNKTIKKIESIAWDLILQSKVDGPRIDVEHIAKHHLNIDVVKHNFGEDITGVLIIKNGKATIGYDENNNSSEVRKRFTIAHELGHYILEHDRGGIFVDNHRQQFSIHYRDSKSSTGEVKQEREANAFAAALLMPKQLLIEEMQKIENNKEYSFSFFDDDDDMIRSLASAFGVSKMAMTYRIDNLGLLARGY